MLQLLIIDLLQFCQTKTEKSTDHQVAIMKRENYMSENLLM